MGENEWLLHAIFIYLIYIYIFWRKHLFRQMVPKYPILNLIGKQLLLSSAFINFKVTVSLCKL